MASRKKKTKKARKDIVDAADAVRGYERAEQAFRLVADGATVHVSVKAPSGAVHRIRVTGDNLLKPVIDLFADVLASSEGRMNEAAEKLSGS